MALKRSLNSRFLPLALAAALVLGAFTGCGKGGEPPALEGTPPQIELDGYTLTLGQTTLQEVLDAGFEKVERLGFAGETIAPYTFSSDLYYLARAGEDGQLVEYAGWGLCNTTDKTQATEACTLCSVYWQLAVGGEMCIRDRLSCSRKQRAAAVRQLCESGVEVYSVIPHRTSLEELFLETTTGSKGQIQ